LVVLVLETASARTAGIIAGWMPGRAGMGTVLKANELIGEGGNPTRRDIS